MFGQRAGGTTAQIPAESRKDMLDKFQCRVQVKERADLTCRWGCHASPRWWPFVLGIYRSTEGDGEPSDNLRLLDWSALSIIPIKKAFSPFGYGLVGSTVSSNVPRSQVLLQSFTAPSGYWYLQNYDRPNLLANGAADWVNIMTYDLHGIWDSPADYISSIVLVVWKCRFRSDLNRAHPAARSPHEPVHAVSSSSFPLRRE
ncbi:hypothetical protein B0H14DRAFT_2597256 [Mycena olivaceomarginata]|nr:hypothetical protein B0H14DRAFT_2597256 [Mycena olivaceomarginata]